MQVRRNNQNKMKSKFCTRGMYLGWFFEIQQIPGAEKMKQTMAQQV